MLLLTWGDCVVIKIVNKLSQGIDLKEHHVRTRCGSVSVIVYGEQDKPALITYPDLALNRLIYYVLSQYQCVLLCHIRATQKHKVPAEI
ncbi:hypothetical protein V6N12_018157 [Hibiscus sabdariffa]|uniref:Uncharacterized protein n=1 Tax=Hibiscus sabdariffa TaxID=183260 RepID=A0ABR2BPI2_9ROSI